MIMKVLPNGVPESGKHPNPVHRHTGIIMIP